MEFEQVDIPKAYIIKPIDCNLYWQGYRGSRSCHDPWTFERSHAKVYSTFAAASAARASIKFSLPLEVVLL